VIYNKYDAPSPLVIMDDTIIAAIGQEVRVYSTSNGELHWTYYLEETRIAWTFISAADRIVIVILEGYFDEDETTVYKVRITAIG